MIKEFLTSGVSKNQLIGVLSETLVSSFISEFNNLPLGNHSKEAAYMKNGPLRHCRSFVLNDTKTFDAHPERDYSKTPVLKEFLIGQVGDLDTIGRCYYTSLLPGYEIYPHADNVAYFNHIKRLHIYLSSLDSSSKILVGSHLMTPKEGELWCFEHKLRHSYSMSKTAHPLNFIVFDIYDSAIPKILD